MIDEMKADLRIPPHSEEAERGVIGSVLLDPDAAMEKAVEAGLVPDSFYDRRHQLLFEHMHDMHRSGSKMDAITIAEWLKNKRVIEKVGGYDYLAQLQDSTLVPAHVTYYAGIVLQKKKYRTLIESASESIDTAYACKEDPEDIAAGLINRSEEIVLASYDEDESTEQTAFDAYAIDTRIANGELLGLPFPWRSFQSTTFGLPEKSMCPIFGRDGKGKSWLATYLAHGWISSNRPVLYFAFEDGKHRVMSRLAAINGGYDMFTLRGGRIPDGFMQNHRSNIEQVSRMPIYFKEMPDTIEKINATISKYKRKYGIQAVIIDGFKDIILSEGENQTTKENHICRMIVTACKRYDVTVIPIMHLTKVEAGKWIYDYNMKGSGTLHQSARFVMAFQDAGIPEWLKSLYNNELNDCVVLEAEKTSYGSNALVVLRPDFESGRFVEITRESLALIQPVVEEEDDEPF